MSRINFFTLSRPQPVTDTRTFTDPAHPGLSIELTASFLPGLSFDAKQEEVRGNYEEDFVSGRADPSDPQKRFPPAPLPAIDDKPVPVTPLLCLYASYLVALDCGPPGEPPYSFEQWAACAATCPQAFKSIVTWADGLISSAAAGAVKNESGAASAEPS